MVYAKFCQNCGKTLQYVSYFEGLMKTFIFLDFSRIDFETFSRVQASNGLKAPCQGRGTKPLVGPGWG